MNTSRLPRWPDSRSILSRKLIPPMLAGIGLLLPFPDTGRAATATGGTTTTMSLKYYSTGAQWVMRCDPQDVESFQLHIQFDNSEAVPDLIFSPMMGVDGRNPFTNFLVVPDGANGYQVSGTALSLTPGDVDIFEARFTSFQPHPPDPPLAGGSAPASPGGGNAPLEQIKFTMFAKGNDFIMARDPSVPGSVATRITAADIGATSRTVTPGVNPMVWDPDGLNDNGTMGGPGTWNTTDIRWDNLSTNVLGPVQAFPNVAWDNSINANDEAVFGGNPGTGIVTVAGTISAGGLRFDMPGYTLQGGSLTLSKPGGAPGTIDTGGNDATVNSPIVGSGGLQKIGKGTVTLRGANTYSGPTTIKAGTVKLDSTGGGILNTASPVTFTGNGKFAYQSVGGSQTLGALSFQEGEGVVDLSTSMGGVNLQFASLAASPRATGNFVQSVGSGGGAQTAYALADNGLSLIRFDLATPNATTLVGTITGTGGNRIDGIDFRPNDGLLYAYSQQANGLFVLNLNNAAATLISTPTTASTTRTLGIDFNPVADRLRLVNDVDQNLRINVATGATVVDGTLAFAAGDPNFGISPSLNEAAYTNSDINPATGTTLFYIDPNLDILVSTPNPNAGLLTTVGALNFNTSDLIGFDILSDGLGGNTAYALLTAPSGIASLFTVNLGTGAATPVGVISQTAAVHPFSLAIVQPVPEPGTLLFGFAAAPPSNQLISARLFFNGADYAAYSGAIRALNYGADLNTSPINVFGPNTDVKLTIPQPVVANTSIRTVNLFGSNANLSLNADTTLTLTQGGILKSGGGASTISHVSLPPNISGGITTGGATELVVRTDTVADVLTIASPILSTTTGGLTKSGAGTLILAAANQYTGPTTLLTGITLVNGSINPASPVSVRKDATLGGSGSVGALTGSGTVSPGTVSPGLSPGILTATSVDPSLGMGFRFEISQFAPNYLSPFASANDVLRLTGATPFTAGLCASNRLLFEFYVPILTVGELFIVGFFTDSPVDYSEDVRYAAYVSTFNGGPMPDDFGVVFHQMIPQVADFGAGPVAGRALQIRVIPEPGTLGLLAMGAFGLLRRGMRRD